MVNHKLLKLLSEKLWKILRMQKEWFTTSLIVKHSKSIPNNGILYLFTYVGSFIWHLEFFTQKIPTVYDSSLWEIFKVNVHLSNGYICTMEPHPQ